MITGDLDLHYIYYMKSVMLVISEIREVSWFIVMSIMSMIFLMSVMSLIKVIFVLSLMSMNHDVLLSFLCILSALVLPDYVAKTFGNSRLHLISHRPTRCVYLMPVRSECSVLQWEERFGIK
jgi:hypothetical protein